MTFDFPHMIVTVLIVFVVVWGMDQTTAFAKMSKGRKTLIKFGVLFTAIFILNILWPYGTGI